MSNGDEFGKPYEGQFGFVALDKQKEATDGEWLDFSKVVRATVHFSDLETGGTIKVHLRNDPVAPDADVDGYLALELSSSDESLQILTGFLPVRWIRFEKTEGTTPEETVANVYGRSA